MKRFQFRLARLGRLARQGERQAGLALARAARQRAEAESRRAAAVEARHAAERQWLGQLLQGSEAGTLLATHAARESARRALQAATVALDVADGRFAAARARWEDAHRRAQVYRRLEDRRRAAHLAEVRRAEQAELDEWASLRMKGGDDE